MQQSAVPEPVRPRALGRHHAGIMFGVLFRNLIFRQRGTVVLRSCVLPETRAVRRRVELGWLLEYDRLAGGGISNAHSLRGGNADAAPERALQR